MPLKKTKSRATRQNRSTEGAVQLEQDEIKQETFDSDEEDQERLNFDQVEVKLEVMDSDQEDQEVITGDRNPQHVQDNNTQFVELPDENKQVLQQTHQLQLITLPQQPENFQFVAVPQQIPQLQLSAVPNQVLQVHQEPVSQQTQSNLNPVQQLPMVSEYNQNVPSEAQYMTEDETLLMFVKEHSFLYNPEDPRYSNCLIRENTWEEIGRKMKSKATDCKTRWKNLRDTYRKALRSRKTRSGRRVSKNRKPWKFEKQMEFLKPYVHTQKESTNNFESAIHVDSDPEEEQDLVEPSPSPAESSPANSLQSQPSKKRAQPQASVAAAAFQNYIQYKMKEGGRSDHIHRYFASIEETVRTFPPHIQIKVKSQISTIIHDAEYEAMTYSKCVERGQNNLFTD